MPDLSNADIDSICEGLTQNAAKVRYLESLGLTVDRKPNGRPLVNAAHYDAVRGRGIKTDAPAPSGIRWSTT